MGHPKRDHVASKAVYFLICLQELPVVPANFVVLAIGVVVSVLSPAKFVSAEQHRDAARYKQCQKKVLNEALAQRLDGWIVAWSFESAILAIVPISAIMIVFPIGLVVFLPVAHKVIQSESVM